MKKTFQFFLLAAVLILAASCQKVMADGPVISQTRNHSGFTAISSSVDAIVTYTQSPDYHVEIRAQQAILDNMRSEIVDGELRFYYPGKVHIGHHEQVNIYVSAPDVSGFTMNGSGELRGETLELAKKTVRFKISGSGSVYFSKLTAEALEGKVSGSGKMTVAAGNILRESCEISGSGDMDFNNLEADDVTAHISGSGTVRTAANKSLDVHISGSGKVYYRGTPRITSSISGSGKLQPN